MKRIAIPVFKGLLSEYFGQCSHYEIIDIENNDVVRDIVEVPPVTEMGKIPLWASKMRITDIIVYKMEKSIINAFALQRINLFVGIPINSPKVLVEEYIKGKLKSDHKIIHELTN